LVSGLADFHVHLGGGPTDMVLVAPGRGFEVQGVNAGLVAAAIAWLDQKRG